MRTVLLVLLVLFVLGMLPAWPHAQSYGYYPSGVGLIALVIVLLFVVPRRGGTVV